MVRLTTPEDHQAATELKVLDKVGVEITNRGEARRLLRSINDLANKIRNPRKRK